MPTISDLAARRIRAKMTQDDLARAAGVSAKTISLAENGHRLRPLTQQKIADALGIPREELFAEPEKVAS